MRRWISALIKNNSGCRHTRKQTYKCVSQPMIHPTSQSSGQQQMATSSRHPENISDNNNDDHRHSWTDFHLLLSGHIRQGKIVMMRGENRKKKKDGKWNVLIIIIMMIIIPRRRKKSYPQKIISRNSLSKNTSEWMRVCLPLTPGLRDSMS